ncbi:GbsR/MarR family transcriptional regulator [Sphaerisporangium fuscum]|uniref:GbsR/MarR family transcriptional regulator n=1 Tax=Sphaerisporangium fuscum TaxID=2835868 RepID=UPI001BDC9912|nr:transcriptional regulator [Sphaerisporangium fuscum]
MPQESGADHEQLLRWVERVAAFCVEEWGLAPITGRILGWLMICDPADQSAGDIADAIGASRASLTSNMRLLMAIGLVRRQSRPGERTTYYRIEDDAWQKVVRRKLAALGVFDEIAEEGLKLTGGEGPRSRRIHEAQESMAWLARVATEGPGGRS